jgi:hypothetical protein
MMNNINNHSFFFSIEMYFFPNQQIQIHQWIKQNVELQLIEVMNMKMQKIQFIWGMLWFKWNWRIWFARWKAWWLNKFNISYNFNWLKWWIWKYMGLHLDQLGTWFKCDWMDFSGMNIAFLVTEHLDFPRKQSQKHTNPCDFHQIISIFSAHPSTL